MKIIENKNQQLCPFQYNDGGREEAGFQGQTGDCVVRAIAIATQLPYKQVYDDLNELSKTYNAKLRKNIKRRSSGSRTGVARKVAKIYMESLGWKWLPVMTIGSGCTMHMTPSELPAGRIILSLSKHFSCSIDGIIHDTYDPSRGGTRCVYGYYYHPASSPINH